MLRSFTIPPRGTTFRRATLLLSQNTPSKFVQELLGHATIAVTLDTYSHAMPGMADHTVNDGERSVLAG